MTDERPFVNVIFVKVTDGRGRTQCHLQKMTHFDENGHPRETERWGAYGRTIKKRPAGVPLQESLLPPTPMRRRGTQLYLELPGLTLKMEKVAAALDRIATELGVIDRQSGAVLVCDPDTPIKTLTVQELRIHVGT